MRPPTACVGHRSRICHAGLTVADLRERGLRFHDIEDLIRHSALQYLAWRGLVLIIINPKRAFLREVAISRSKGKDDCPVDISATLSTF